MIPTDPNAITIGIVLFLFGVFFLIVAFTVKTFRYRYTGQPVPRWIGRIVMLAMGSILMLASWNILLRST